MKLPMSRALFAASAAVLLLAPVHAVPERAWAPWTTMREICRLRAVVDPTRSQTHVAEPARASVRRWHGLMEGAAPSSTITVNYSANFPAAAKPAFQSAVDVWAAQITSPVTIVIEANWVAQASGLLGTASAAFVYRDVSGLIPSVFYYSALANKLHGSDLDTDADIIADFNSTRTDWYFGTDGMTPVLQYDFKSVVLHELGHGLGFSGTGSSNGSTGTIGQFDGNPPAGTFPYIFDRFTESAAGQSLLNTAFFPNPSVALHNALTSDGPWSPGQTIPLDPNTGIYWNGTNGVTAAGGGSNRPRLDANAPFDDGSNFSHLNDINYPKGSANSLMTRALSDGESIHSPGPLTLGIFMDEGWSPSCNYSLSPASATVATAASTGNTVAVTAPAGCAWTATAPSGSFVTITGGNSGTGSGTVTYSVAAAPSSTPRSTTLTIAGNSFVVTQGPLLSIDHATLRFGAVNSGGTLSHATSAQTVAVTITGGTGVAWTAAPAAAAPWLTITNGSGTGSGTFNVSVKSDPSLASATSVTAAINITASGAVNSPKTVAVTLTLSLPGMTTAPSGSFDTPAQGSVNAGSVAVTGWALDDIEVVRVQIQRDAHPNDPPGAVFNGRVFIADAVFVEGARPDVEAAAPTSPLNYRAGWGYLMLTRGLVWDGQGSFSLYAIATDKEGNSATIGTKTITVNNSISTKPFGSIDTPGQGATVSGQMFNFGWGLTPGSCKIQSNGVQVSIDSGPLQPVVYGDVRPEIAAGFAGFTNSAAAGGHYLLDSTLLANGTHTIGWLITDDCGNVDGVGSRFFKVQNSSLVTTTATLLNEPASVLAGIDNGAAIRVRRGFDSKAPVTTVTPDAFGRRHVRIGQWDRVEVRLVDQGVPPNKVLPPEKVLPPNKVLPPKGGSYQAYLVANGQLRRLPVGSSFDPRKGVLYWQPVAGFAGDFEFVIVDQARRDARRLTRLVVSVGEALRPPRVLATRATD